MKITTSAETCGSVAGVIDEVSVFTTLSMIVYQLHYVKTAHRRRGVLPCAFRVDRPNMKLALFLHLLSAVIWVGGMFFAYLCLRPAAGSLEPPSRLGLWVGTFERFFVWVWAAVILLPATGYWLIAKFGGFANVGVYVHIMHALGIAMILVFLHVYFAPYRRLRKSVSSGDFGSAAKQLNQIRILVAVNLSLGLLVLMTVRLLR